jgi:hypothetical protein
MEGADPPEYNGRQVRYSYNYGTAGATDDIMSRLSTIFDHADGDGVLDAGGPDSWAIRAAGPREVFR